ncbi:hypothetical protein [Macrococcus capreoli]|uniref:hypothetical protein n=1 Tax=Macrococcus capreoli TaxID=2982690 RepID=UPI0021D5FC63|nr:hypothetical protein [Macrococcus sp. TMW 2.2395]MCU7556573.1 hypothetical protein [Macrococcus sp. TMW 2.2395]
MKEIFAYGFILAASFVLPFIFALVVGGIADVFFVVDVLHNALIYAEYTLMFVAILLALDYVQVHTNEED